MGETPQEMIYRVAGTLYPGVPMKNVAIATNTAKCAISHCHQPFQTITLTKEGDKVYVYLSCNRHHKQYHGETLVEGLELE